MSTKERLGENEQKAVQEVAAINERLLSGEAADYNRAVTKVREQLERLNPPRGDLLGAALCQMSAVNQLRVLTFSLCLAKEAKRLRDETATSKKDVWEEIRRLGATLTSQELDVHYNFNAEVQPGPELRAAIRLTDVGFRKLCKRANVTGTRRLGQPTMFSRQEVVLILKAHIAPMNEDRCRAFVAALGSGTSQNIPQNY